MGMTTLFGGAFNQKTVLVTGHSGFKGGWLSLWLTQLGAKVVGYALPPNTRPDFYSSCELDRLMHSNFGDVRDVGHLQKVLETHQPEIIFHLAAQPLVRHSYDEPLETFSSNVMGTANVLEVARRTASVKAVVIVTSDKCYENREWDFAYRENDAMGGWDPYSASKGAAELITASYRRSYFEQEGSAAVVSVRAGNVIGGGDWSQDRLIPDCIRALRDNQRIELRQPDSLRPWQYVLEPLAGYLMLAAKLLRNERTAAAWNFGPLYESSVPVGELVDRLCQSWGGGEWLDVGEDNAKHEAKLLRLDCSLAQGVLGWHPVYDFITGLGETVGWYRQFCTQNGQGARELSLEQLRRYVKEARRQGLVWAV